MFVITLQSPSCPQDITQWNKLIKHKLSLANHRQTISSYIEMKKNGLFADNYTFPLLLKAASNLQSFCLASALHAHSIVTGYYHHAFVQTSLINMYSAFEYIENARKVFDGMPQRDVVAWNSMLDAYACCNMVGECEEMFNTMPCKDQVSFNIMTSCFVKADMEDEAEELFDFSPVRDGFTWNSMMLLHVKGGRIGSARALFERMQEKDVVSWSTILVGYLQNKSYCEVLNLFERMQTEQEPKPNHVIFVTVLSACANLGNLKMGTKIHKYAQELGLSCNSHVATALIDMYCKCGNLTEALLVFYKTPIKDIFCWNSMISGFALQGYGHDSLKLFEDMQSKGQKPDDITFIGLLTACSHAGLVAEGLHFFEKMQSQYDLMPKHEHYGCVVSLLGRAGRIHDAYQIMKDMKFEPGISILGALLTACVVHGNVEVGEEIAHAIATRGDAMKDGEYVMLANFYAMCGRMDEATRWRGIMNEQGVAKEAGCSKIIVGDIVHEFLAGELKN